MLEIGNNKPVVSYEEWLLTAGKRDNLGVRIRLTHSLLKKKHEELTENGFKVVSDAFEQAMFNKGQRPVSIEFETEEKPEMRARELTALLAVNQGASLEEYAPVVYAQAKDFYNQVKVWERKSLWQYIKWWLKRKFNER